MMALLEAWGMRKQTQLAVTEAAWSGGSSRRGLVCGHLMSVTLHDKDDTPHTKQSCPVEKWKVGRKSSDANQENKNTPNGDLAQGLRNEVSFTLEVRHPPPTHFHNKQLTGARSFPRSSVGALTRPLFSRAVAERGSLHPSPQVLLKPLTLTLSPSSE